MFPDIGAPRPRFGPHTRIAILSPYILFYDHIDGAEAVTIIRVIDGRRNVTPRLVRE